MLNRKLIYIFIAFVFLSLAIAIPVYDSVSENKIITDARNISFYTNIYQTNINGSSACSGTDKVINVSVEDGIIKVYCEEDLLGTYGGSYNSSYDTWLSNYSEYSKFWYNHTLSTYNLYNSLWSSTYNSSYDTWLSNYSEYSKFWYNQTTNNFTNITLTDSINLNSGRVITQNQTCILIKGATSTIEIC